MKCIIVYSIPDNGRPIRCFALLPLGTLVRQGLRLVAHYVLFPAIYSKISAFFAPLGCFSVFYSRR